MNIETVMQRSFFMFCCLWGGMLPCTGSEIVVVSENFREVIFAIRPLSSDPHYYANFGYYCSAPDEKVYPQGGQLCRLNLQTKDLTLLLDAATGSVRDPQMHYDGTKLLFFLSEATRRPFSSV